MSLRATEPSFRSSVQKVDDTFNRKVLPFRRDSTGGTGVAATEQQLQAEIGALEREIGDSANRSLSDTLALVVERLGSLTGADGAAIALRDERGLFCGASQGQAPDVGSVLQPGSGLTRQCFETGQVVTSEDAESDSRVQLSIAQSLRLRSVLAVPIRTPDSVLGVVEVLSSRPSAFDTMHVDALQRVTNALARILVPGEPQVVAVPAEPRPWLSRGKLIFLAILLGLLGLLFGLALTRRTVLTKSAQPADMSSSNPTAASTAQAPNPSAVPSSANPQSPAPENTPEASAPPSPAVPAGSIPGKAESPAAEPPAPPASVAKTTPENNETVAGLDPVPPPAPAEIAKAAAAPAVTATSVPSALISPAVPLPSFALEHTLNAHAGWVTSVAFTAGGQRLAAADWDKAIDVWDVSSGQQVGAIGGEIKELQAVAASRDGRWLAGEDSGNTVTIWDAASGREVRSFPGHRPSSPGRNNWVYSIAFSPDGRRLAAAVDDKTVRVWDVETGRTLRDLEGRRRSVIYVAFSPDGSLLATGGDDKSIKVWDLPTGRVVQTLTGHKKVVCAVAFSPNGRWLASASRDNSVKLWDLATGHEVRTLIGHRDSVTTVAFSPDGRWLASGSWDKTIKIWDLATGRELETLAGHTRHVYTVAIESRGRWLASGSEDGAIKLWQVGKSAGQKP